MSTPPPPTQSAMDRGKRRGSWARAFDKVRAAMKRRGSSSRNTVADAPSSPVHSDPEPSKAVVEVAKDSQATVRNPEPSTAPTKAVTLQTNAVAAEESLVTGAGIEVDTEEEDRHEPLFPMLSTRTAVSEEKARELFAKYGLHYETRGKRNVTEEPPTKIRRVEKPVRLRVHWTCHECRTQFGIEKTCMQCGHRRCRECSRHPPKRVKQISDDARRRMEQENTMAQEALMEQEQAAASEVAPGNPDLQQYRQEPAAAPRESITAESSHSKESPSTSAPPRPAEPVSQPLELDDNPDEGESMSMTQTHYFMYARPRMGIQTILIPKAHISSRTCHKCEASIQPGQRDCANCGHVRCELCPRKSHKHQNWSQQIQQLAHDDVPMVKAVQRVYRKPRQRVRYTCENCNTLFIDTDRCHECGHQRCQSCNREPPKRPPVVHDPALLQAVADRLAGYGGFDRPSQSITASAG